MYCRNCGINVPDGAAFCANCGASVTDPGHGAVATAASDPGTGIPPIDMSPGGQEEDQLLTLTKEHLGKDYRIDKELGRGGMAVVYKGVEMALERTVAIKVVPPDSANVGQAAERFRREAKLAASLDHPNIIPVYRVGQAGPLHYMAMKFVEGRAVDSILEQQGALPIPVCVALLRYAAAGLAFAHDKKIVHRDIKPANILVDRDGRVMVSDFGIARALEEVSLTASGMMIGTPYYMSPEQCGGQKVSPQSDQYSLGIMGFQLVTGEVPFNADSMVGVIQHHYMTPVPDILLVRPDVPKELLEIIYCALNKDPADRFNTTAEMARALESVPQTEEEREEAEKLLKELSAGHPIPKVRTGTLPPLMLTISGPGPRIQPRPITEPKTRPATMAKPGVRRRKKKKNKMMAPALFLIFASMGGAGYMIYDQNAQTAAQQRRQDSIAAAAAAAEIAAARAMGKLVFTGLPTGGSVEVAGRVFFSGQIDSLSPGTYRATASAEGYQDRVRTVVVEAGRADTLDMTLTPRTAVANLPAQPGARPSVAAPRDSGDVRLIVSPLYADIYISGERKGTGRVQARVPVGSHPVRFTAPNCTAVEFSITVVRGETTIVPPQTLTCQ